MEATSPSNKGQTDIIGLMVIVILLVVLGGLYLAFSSQPESTGTQATTISVQLNSFMESIRDYTICPNQAFEKAAKPCLNGNTEFCGGKACAIIEREMQAMMKAAYKKEMEAKRISLEFLDDKNQALATAGKLDCTNKVCESSDISAGAGKRAKLQMCRCSS